jgi:uncharacterized membrane protein
MRKSRLEAFSDGVIAIIITIMVLEMKVPHGDQLDDLKKISPVFLSYILSFINIGIYWNNHHHMLHAVQIVDGKVLWANIHLLFWLSLIPFGSGWMGENNFTLWPVVVYGLILLMSGVAYTILARTFINLHGKNSTLATALGKDSKGKQSILIYAAAIALSFINPYFGLAGYALVALMWFIPDKRIEKKLSPKNADTEVKAEGGNG